VVDARLDGLPEDGQRDAFVARRPEDPGTGQLHGAEAHRVDGAVAEQDAPIGHRHIVLAVRGPGTPLPTGGGARAGCETGPVRVVGNVLWLVFGGLVMAVCYALAGVVMCILIITIPFGVASFRLAGYTLWPFGRTVVAKPGAGVGSFLLNVIWFVLAGLWLAIGHLVSGIVLCLTIIGIPLGMAHFKLIPICVAPLGKQIVPSGRTTPMAAV